MSKLYDIGSCSWYHGQPDRGASNPSAVLLGPCPECGCATFTYGGGWRCTQPYCSKSYSNPAPTVGPKPDWWETNINVSRDGDMWMASLDGFINIQESACEFAPTPQEAVDKLRAATAPQETSADE